MDYARNEQWVATYLTSEDDNSYSPRELRAQAMALTVLGLSSRQIETRLRAMFPVKKTPPWSTIARWARSRPANRIAALRWFDVAQRAAQIVEQRMDEIDASKTPLLELLVGIGRPRR